MLQFFKCSHKRTPLNKKKFWFNLTKEIFLVYKNYTFKKRLINLFPDIIQQLFQQEEVVEINHFVDLIDTTINFLSLEDQQILDFVYIKNLKYNETFFSKSVYYTKRNLAVTHFISLLFEFFNTNDLFLKLNSNFKE